MIEVEFKLTMVLLITTKLWQAMVESLVTSIFLNSYPHFFPSSPIFYVGWDWNAHRGCEVQLARVGGFWVGMEALSSAMVIREGKKGWVEWDPEGMGFWVSMSWIFC